MNFKKPLFLISNDDGYKANGIRTLASFLTDIADIIVCAPTEGRSGYSRAFSAIDYLRLSQKDNIPGCQTWACSGTPIDCVKIAMSQITPDRVPDLILSGINHGDNSTINNHYSGTVGVAIEGCLKHIPSIAFSSCDYDTKADLSGLSGYVRKIVKKVLADGLPTDTCLNVNFPKANDFKGIKVCRMGRGSWINEIEKRQHPRGFNYYWVVGKYKDDEPTATDNDRWALENGYIAVTPTKVDVTAYEAFDALQGLEEL